MEKQERESDEAGGLDENKLGWDEEGYKEGERDNRERGGER